MTSFHRCRYLLHRIAEEYGINASFDPKPLPGDWNGAGAHVNFCYTDFREAGPGLEYVPDLPPPPSITYGFS